MKRRILVLCTGNSCRSQMLEGWLKFYLKGEAIIESAGIETHGVNPDAILSMQRAGVDISNHVSLSIDAFAEKSWDFLITVCDHAKESCPTLPGVKKIIHHSFEDPASFTGKDKPLLFDKVRDQIELFARQFISEQIKDER